LYSFRHAAIFAPGIQQVLKPAHVQTLFAHPSVKAFHMCVLRRLPRLNMHQLDLPFHAPSQEVTARQLWTVVAADRQWLPALGHNLFQHPGHSPAGEARSHFQSQTLPRWE